MRSVVYKYQLTAPFNTIRNGRILCVAEQFGIPTVWVQHNLMEPHTQMTLQMFGTGQEFDLEGWEFVGTSVGHQFVFHVYRRI